MSATKRLKLEADPDTSRVEKTAEIIVDLGNGLLGRLRTHGTEDATIEEERWQQFKAELYQSAFWQQYKEQLDSRDWDKSEQSSKESYNEVIEREIQRAWDESGKGNNSLRMPQSVGCKEFSSFLNSCGELPYPDIPLCDQDIHSVEKGEPSNGRAVELKEETVMIVNGGGLQRYLVMVEYLGSRFLGWQKQKNRPDLRTVQGVLEEAFHKFVGQPVGCGGSSRTDTGVHALANVCHVDVQRVSKRKPGVVVGTFPTDIISLKPLSFPFYIEMGSICFCCICCGFCRTCGQIREAGSPGSEHPRFDICFCLWQLPPHEPEVVKRAVNHFLQKDGGDVVVVDVKPVRNDFHSRFQARERTYHYRIISGCAHSSIFEKDRAWHVPENLNLAAMQEASQVLVGHHDFSSFRAAGCQAKSPLKTLDELHVCEMPVFPCFPSPSERIAHSLIPQAKQLDVRDLCSPKAIVHGSEPRTGICSMPTATVVEAPENTERGYGVASMKSLGTPRCYVITARARSFLYHQVRLLVGTVKAVGCGVLTVEDVKRILAAKSIKATPAMAPAFGLYLAEVKYDFSDFKTRENTVNWDEEDE